MEKSLFFESNNEEETFNAGSKAGSLFKKGDVVALKGNLGVGKSVFVRGASSALGVNDNMPSPTFSIVNEYFGSDINVYHFDLYRINDPYELYAIGFEDYIYSDAVSFIEWFENAGELIPDKYILVTIEQIDTKRKIYIKWKE